MKIGHLVNAGKTNPIRTQSKPIKANKMPKQTQYEPKQTQFQRLKMLLLMTQEIATEKFSKKTVNGIDRYLVMLYTKHYG